MFNLINGKIYVGSSINLRDRRKQHFTMLRCKRHPNRYLQNTFNNHGEHNFEFKVFKLIENKKDLIEQEQCLMDKTKCTDRKYGYNIAPRAQSNLGERYTEETKRKMSKDRIGKFVSEETKQKISKSKKGHKKSKETRERMSKAKKGIIFTEEHRKNLGKASLGRTLSESAKKKVSLANQGEKHNMVKLNETQVKIIRSLIPDLKNKTMRLIDIAEYFNVSFHTISLIKCGKIWTHI